MPSRIIHYCIANEILKLKKYNRELFVLGNLAPDAYVGEKNYVSHFRIPKEQRKNDYLDIQAFKTKYMVDGYDDVIAGYYCHLITDNLWLKNMYRKYVSSQSEEEKQKRSQLCYRDYTLLNPKLIHFYQLQNIEINIPNTTIFDEIDNQQLQRVIESFHGDLIDNNTIDEPLSLLNFNSVLDFIKMSINVFMDKI